MGICHNPLHTAYKKEDVMVVHIDDKLKIVKETIDTCWTVMVFHDVKKKNGSTGSRKKCSYHGTLAQALRKVLDLRCYSTDDNDVIGLRRTVLDVEEEMELVAKRIEKLLILQA